MIISTTAKEKEKSEDSDFSDYFADRKLEISIHGEDLLLKFSLSLYNKSNTYKINMKELHKIIHMLED